MDISGTDPEPISQNPVNKTGVEAPANPKKSFVMEARYAEVITQCYHMYDFDQNGSIDVQTELPQLVANLVFKLRLKAPSLTLVMT